MAEVLFLKFMFFVVSEYHSSLEKILKLLLENYKYY